jgi:hypothetical protein
MAQNTVALLCVGSLLTWDDAVVIPCDHPASPFAQSGPAIAVPRIRTLGVENVRPDLTAEGAHSAHQHQTASGESGRKQYQHQPASTEGGAGQTQAASAKMGARQHQHHPVWTSGGAQHRHQ